MDILSLLPDNLASLSVTAGTSLFGGGALVKAWPAIKGFFGNVETKIAAAVDAVKSEVAALEAKTGTAFQNLGGQWGTELQSIRSLIAKTAADFESRLQAVEGAVGIHATTSPQPVAPVTTAAPVQTATATTGAPA